MFFKKTDKRKKSSPANDLVITGPTNFQTGVHVGVEKDTGEVKGLPKKYANQLGLAMSQKTEDGGSESMDEDNSLPEVLRITTFEEAKKRKEAEERERKRREKEKKEQLENRVEITGVLRVEHKLHVDENLNWSGDEAATSLQLLKKLGEGAYGAVFKAVHIPTAAIIAVKTVNVGSEAVEDTMKEIDILKKCRDDNIVSLFGCLKNEDQLWILMDFCGLGAVRDWMKRHKKNLTEEQAQAVTYYTLIGLEYLHSHEIIHRDLKAANILVTQKGEVKIADFGVSYQISNTMAKAKTVIGTPLFMSPEALQGGEYSEVADIWSLGITCMEMVEGNPPYHEEHIMRAMLLITTQPPPTLTNKERYSQKFHDFLARCLKAEPKERPTAKELLTDPWIVDIIPKAKQCIMQMVGEDMVLRAEEEASLEDEKDLNHKSPEPVNHGLSGNNNSDEKKNKERDKENKDKENKEREDKEKEDKKRLLDEKKQRRKSRKMDEECTGELIGAPVLVNNSEESHLKGPDPTIAMREMEKLMIAMHKELTETQENNMKISNYTAMTYRELTQNILQLQEKQKELEAKIEKYKKFLSRE